MTAGRAGSAGRARGPRARAPARPRPPSPARTPAAPRPRHRADCGAPRPPWRASAAAASSALRRASSSAFLRASSSAWRLRPRPPPRPCGGPASSASRRAFSSARWRASSSAFLASTSARTRARLLLVGQRLEHHRAGGPGRARPRPPARPGGCRRRVPARPARRASRARPARRRARARPARLAGLEVALALDLDRNRLAPAVREALPDHAAVDGLLQLEPAARPRQRDPRVASCSLVSVIVVRSFPSARSLGRPPARSPAGDSRSRPAESPPAAPRPAAAAAPGHPAPRRHAPNSRAPDAAPSSALENAAISGRSGASRRSFAPPVGRTVVRRHQHRRAARAQPRAHLLETQRDLTGAPRQAQGGERTPRQQAARPARRDPPPRAPAPAPPARRGSWRRPCLPHPGPRSTTYRARQARVEIGHAPGPSGSSTKRSS